MGTDGVEQSMPEHAGPDRQDAPEMEALEIGNEGDWEAARDLLGYLEDYERWEAIQGRLKRLAGISLGGAAAVFILPVSGLAGVILSLWSIVGLGFGSLSLFLWVSMNRYTQGAFEAPDVEDGSEIDVDREVIFLVLAVLILAWFVRATRHSARARVLWSLLMGEASLRAVDAVAEERHQVDDADMQTLNRKVTRAAQLSVGLIGIDLFIRYAPTDAIIFWLATGGQSPSWEIGGPTLPAVDICGSLSSLEWIGVFAGLLVVGAVVGVVLAVTFKR